MPRGAAPQDEPWPGTPEADAASARVRLGYEAWWGMPALPKLNTIINEKTFPYVMFPADECNQRDPKPQPGCSEVVGQ